MNGTVVVVGGVLHGMQREVKCEVLARKKPLNFDPDYSEGFVLHAPADLPDGNYSVKFDGT